MKIVWFNWKDREHPRAGGAEVVGEAIAERLVRDGHEVIFIVAGFSGCAPEAMRHGFRVIRVGGRTSVYWHAWRTYRARLRGWADVAIDEINTLPFFAAWYTGVKTFLFPHQLCREIWFYEMPFPLSVIGYIAEAVYMRLLSPLPVITVSESTKRDLLRFGFRADRIHIISEGIEMQPIADLAAHPKLDPPTILAIGSIRAMKRTTHIVRAFELAKPRVPDLKLIIAGRPNGAYGARVLRQISQSPFASSITFKGPFTPEERETLMRQAHVVCMASVKEGWGLVVTEAASQGTPAVVYNVDGLRDSVKDGKTGMVCRKNTPEGMADGIVDLLADKRKYEEMRRMGWEGSGEIRFEKSYLQFLESLNYV